MGFDGFFAAPDLDESESFQKSSTSKSESIIGGESNSESVSTARYRNADDICGIDSEMTDELRSKFSKVLQERTAATVVKNAVIDNPKERVIIRFSAPDKNIDCDIDVPLDISANDLVIGLNIAYKLGLDTSDMRQNYLSCENPMALLKGKKLLGEFGIRDGSLITFHR